MGGIFVDKTQQMSRAPQSKKWAKCEFEEFKKKLINGGW
jgi:hypothetical protein